MSVMQGDEIASPEPASESPAGFLFSDIPTSKGLPMRYLMRLLSIAFAIMVWPLTATLAAFSYQPSAHESLALDRMAKPVAVLPAARSRFRAFVDSARAHADFSAGHFDPGRLAA